MQLVERINDKLLKESISVLKMSKQTGIPSYRIYKWIDGKGNPKAEDAAILEQWLSGNLDIVPNSKQYNVNDPNNPAYIAGQLAMAERLIAKLEENNEEAKADKEKLFKALNEAQKTINEVLKPIKERTEEILTNSNDVKLDTSLSLDYQRAWVEYTAEQASGGDKKKKDQIVLHMNKLLRSQIGEGHKEGKSADVHRQHRVDK